VERHRDDTGSVDRLLILVTVLIVAFGVLALFSASFAVGDDFWRKQILWISIGALAAVLVTHIPYSVWAKVALPLLGVTLVMLLITVLFGDKVWGARRGLVAGSSIQPGVLARLITVIYIAAWLASKGEELNQVRTALIPFGVIIGVTAVLVMAQKDLSTAFLLIGTGLLMFFFAGGDPLQIFFTVIIGTVGGGAVAMLLPYSRERLADWVASFSDPTKMPYQVWRAFQAISHGGVTGTGLGRGVLKFGYLPVPHTDSIFAVIAEEAGLLGCLIVLGLFAVFAWRGYRIALSTANPFGSLIAFGVTTMIISEAALNIAVMVGLFPPTGTALPFFSYGGTGMVVNLVGLGLLLSVSRGRPRGVWDEALDRWWRNWRTRLSGARRRPGFGRSL